MKQKILLGVTGTVASILTRKIVTQFVEAGFDVGVVLTESAKSFTNAEDLAGTGHSGTFDDSIEWPTNSTERVIWKKDDPVPHIDLRNEYSAFVVLCSANSLAKIVNGQCDNLLTSIARAWEPYKPFVLAPAMNTTMWNHPITAQHILQFLGFSSNNSVVYPQEKMLACGTMGQGALADIDIIVNHVSEKLTWTFPLKTCFGIPTYPHPGAFAYPRRGRKHTGIDLYTNQNEPVFAVEDGVVVNIEHFTGEWDNSPWWNNTDCVMVRGASGVVNYGEVIVNPWVKVGTRIGRGQAIAEVTRVIKEGHDHYEIPGWRPTMLHVELYPWNALKASHGFEEQLLNDATPFLLNAYRGPDISVTYDKYNV